jgi:hypothetical protein
VPVFPTTLYCTRADVEAIASIEGVSLRLDDDQSGSDTGTESTYLTSYGIGWASGQVNFYLLATYAADQLALSPMVNYWASCLATLFIAKRRLNPVPKSLAEEVGKPTPVGLETGIFGLMASIKRNDDSLADIYARVSQTPAASNMVFDNRYPVNKLRVQRWISDRTPRNVLPAIDYTSEYYGDL